MDCLRIAREPQDFVPRMEREYLPDERISPQENVRAGRMALPPCHLLYQFYVGTGRAVCPAVYPLQRCLSRPALQYRVGRIAGPHAGTAVRPASG